MKNEGSGQKTQVQPVWRGDSALVYEYFLLEGHISRKSILYFVNKCYTKGARRGIFSIFVWTRDIRSVSPLDWKR